jgi:hypothetical protein
MAQAVRVVTSEDISRAMAESPQLTELDASLVETVLTYIENNDLDSAHTYAAAMTQAGLGRTLRNLVSAISVLAVALVRKRMMR